MPDVADLLTAVREELIRLNLGRRASEGANAVGAPYPVVVEPGSGPPAPGELGDIDDSFVDHRELVITLAHSGDLGEAGFDIGHQRRAVVDVHYRARTPAAHKAALGVDAIVRRELVTPARNYGFGFELGAAAPVFVRGVAVWGGLGPISRTRERGFHDVAKYLFDVAP